MRVAPAALGITNAVRAPKIFNRGEHTVVQHSEYVGDVITDTLNEFAYDTYFLNPSDETTFPWLSAIAKRFESYRFSKFAVEYRGFAGTSTTGEVTTCIDYDSSDATNNASKAMLLNTGNSVSCPMWSRSVHNSTKTDLQRIGPYRFVSETSTTSRTDSVGNLFIATSASSLPAGSTIGEVWLNYECEFLTPVLEAATTTFTPMQVATSFAGTRVATTDIMSLVRGGNVTTIAGQAMAQVGLQTDSLPGPPGLAAAVWRYASGAVVDNQVVLVKFARDFVGKIVLGISGDDGGPNLNSSNISPVRADTAGTSGTASNQGVDFVYNYVDSLNASTIAEYTGNAVIDMIASAGTGFSWTAPSFSPGDMASQIEFVPVQTSIAAFRAQMQQKRIANADRVARLKAPAPVVELGPAVSEAMDVLARLNEKRVQRGAKPLSPDEFTELMKC